MIDASFIMFNGKDKRIQICYKREPILSIDDGRDWNLSEDEYVLHRWISIDFSHYIDTELYHQSYDDDNLPSYVCKIYGVDEI